MSLTRIRPRGRWIASLLLLVGLLAPATVGHAAGRDRAGVVYTLGNAAAGNAVLAFDRAADGTLAPAGAFPTGGLGTGAGLGSQGALVLDRGGRLLFAVNAGSDDVSVLRVGADGPSLVQRIGSGGTRPISLAVHHRWLYVLNAGGEGNLTGFEIGPHGRLSPLAGSTRSLGVPATNPAQVAFSPDGESLVVTEKATNQIATYAVGRDGRATGPSLHPSAGAVPFGFDFGHGGTLVVSEAAGSASSYRLDDDELGVVSAAVPTNQGAPCWLVVTEDGRYAYTANAAGGSISGFRVDHRGALTALSADGRTGVTGPGSHPIDEALSHGSRYLYAVVTGPGGIAGFAVQADGTLRSVGTVTGVPPSAAGLVAS